MGSVPLTQTRKCNAEKKKNKIKGPKPDFLISPPQVGKITATLIKQVLYMMGRLNET